jgi:glycosyltransferase involved in cell wall biosynthesis
MSFGTKPRGDSVPVRPRVVFITNICPHYRVRTFETFAKYCAVTYYFYSAGDEWYWQQKHGRHHGDFQHEYLPGFRIAGTRVTPTLPWKLLRQNCDVVIKCINGKFALPVTYWSARLRRKPFVLWTGVWMTLQTPFQRLIWPLTRHVYKNADAIVTYGEHVRTYLLEQGVPAEKIFCAPHAIDNDLYSQVVPGEKLRELRRKLALSERDRVVLYLGRLEEVKGLDYLVRAFHELNRPDTRLVIAGEGGEGESLRQLAADLQIGDRVRFAGYVPPSEAPGYYASAEVLVLPSVTVPTGKETWGLVVNEAMNQGVPVIGTSAVGAAAGGLLQDGINGLIVPERDSSALAGALQRVLDSPELRDRLSRNARERIATWDNERMVLGFRNAVDYVLRKRS